ncbi:hypothetical protein CO154_01460 [Candidatus Pacearchaeota archaeon CG_4_9_14_3_um_filter_31_7]|nr:MAG: hypothetical protein AUJ10_03185 [Candidatus Pacearchaeota archaeon CG1_02_31_27]PIN92410.1 MAG: hypothetical protein COU55_01235 [Candidatus Pacearchaeota archaeon CG10_big_fil_rev_8_21_14_0_10_31_59]PIZ80994.1 MAG: hypothetical protein COX99_00940 [Candidatus Pacearchaeota archaeon CG_4_10_14_0_2_um_filter_31_10]PJA70723.1 MAG: hypothetical protein CO154_01460 [Candidatus Pacearchaeota archaeon CG_4_9_14_3_um_filter_31_7]
MNKKGNFGSESLMWIMMFLLIAIIVFAFIVVLVLHYSQNYDIRNLEQNFLIDKAYKCVTKNNYFNEESFTEEKILKCMDFSHDVKNDLALEVSFHNINSEEIKKIFLGYDLAMVLCDTEKKLKGEIPVCAKQKFFVPSEKGDGVLTIKLSLLRLSKND